MPAQHYTSKIHGPYKAEIHDSIVHCNSIRLHSIIELLLNHGADDNAQDDYLRNPLYWALMEDHGKRGSNMETVLLLLEKSADIYARTKQKRTPC